MPVFQIHRLKETQRQQFRWAPHTIGVMTVKSKDYEASEVVDADTVYAVWDKMRESDRPLKVGDLLEMEGGPLRIYKYVGFEEAHWFVPPPLPQPETAEHPVV